MKIATIVFLAAVCLAAPTLGAAADPVTLKFSTTMPGLDPVIKDGVLPLLDEIAKESGGTVEIETFTGGQLTANPSKLLDAETNGLDDMTIIVSSYLGPAFPDAGLFELPGLIRSPEEAGYAGWKMYKAGLLRGMDGFHTLAVLANDPGSIFLARKVTSLAALKGLKIRVSGPSPADIVRRLGAAPVGMSATEIAEGLDRGLYDGTLNGWTTNHSFRATPLVRTAYDLNLGVPQFFLTMNETVYENLPPAAKQAVDRNSGLAVSVRLSRLMASEGLADKAAAAKNGVLLRLSPAEQQQFDAAMRPLIDAWVASIPDGAKKLAFLQNAVAEYRRSQSQ